MKITFDPNKNQRNIVERDWPFWRAAEFDWPTAIIEEDNRKSYPETRLIALGYLDGRMHSLCFSPVDEEDIRVISFRKANKREEKYYEKKAAYR